MIDTIAHKQQLANQGFTIIDCIYSTEEINNILSVINTINNTTSNFRKSTDLFAIRQFLKEVPASVPLIFNEALKSLISKVAGNNYFVVKSIYFDKPVSSNWYVSYHQDLTISVDKKLELPGFTSWTVKQQQYAVQPPVDVLENITTIRIHLDDTDENNGALRVVPASHLKKIYRPEMIDWETEDEVYCNVGAGSVMVMKPLLLHSSGRTTNDKKRRVIHIEFSSQKLPAPLNWAEQLAFS